MRPAADQLLFLPERPYLPPGTLRQALTQSGQEDKIADEQILTALRALDLDLVVSRTRGLDVEQDWDTILSLDEQQLLAFTRILLATPQFVFLDHPGNTLRQEQFGKVLTLLCENAITYVTFGDNGDPLGAYDAVLAIDNAGGWQWKTLHEGQVIEAASP